MSRSKHAAQRWKRVSAITRRQKEARWSIGMHTMCLLQHFMPSYWWNPEEFLGPAALLQSYRWICDCRDEYTEERLQALTEDQRRFYKCRAIKNCTAACPKCLNPADAIHKMKTKHLLSQPIEKVESK